MRSSGSLQLSRVWMVAALSVGALGGSAADAQPPERQAHELARSVDSSVVLAPGPEYARGGMWTAIAGRHYRDLWTTPIRVPVLDLRSFAGGLTVVRQHVGSQTKSLRLAGADGREYQFRSVDKDPTGALAQELQGTTYAKVLRDAGSASFPAAPLVANALLQATGVLVQRQMLVVMPDDPALGEFRSGFKGALGLLEERQDDTAEPNASSAEARRVISSTGLFRRVDASPDDRVDARAFLRARLMDIFMGDRDRHRDNFRWAAAGKGRPTLWQPISRDHDEAFVNHDGFALDLLRIYYQPLVTFGAEYPAHDHLNWHAREVDRRFLVELDRATWDSVATALQATLSDSTIDAAVHHMPAEMYRVGGERLARTLRKRRDGLVREALSYYDFLAREVEIRATDAPEVAEVTRVDPHHVDVAIRARSAQRPYFERRFDDGETREVRLMMWGGDDQVIVRGADASSIRLRVVGGKGDDAFVDSTRRDEVRFYDDRGHNSVEGIRRVDINTKHHDEWVGSDTNRYPPRDWGTWTRPFPWVEVNSDVGLFLGAGLVHTTYGFRRDPYASEIRARIGYSTGASAVRADFDGDFHPENASYFWRLHVLASGTEVLRYYGQGNDTPALGNSDFYRVSLQRYELGPAFAVPIGRSARVSAGPIARWTRPGNNPGQFFAPLRDTLTGGGDFGQLVGRIAFELDTRDREINPQRGVHLYGSAEVDPPVWNVPNTYGAGEVRAEVFQSAALPGAPTLGLRVGGRQLWGSFPFFDSAFLGGASTLAGYHSNRFAGDASVYGGAGLRLTAGHSHLPIPALWGIFGNINAGRVYVDGSSPGGWHSGGGGGLWLALLGQAGAISLGVATSREGTLVQAGTAFGF